MYIKPTNQSRIYKQRTKEQGTGIGDWKDDFGAEDMRVMEVGRWEGRQRGEEEGGGGGEEGKHQSAVGYSVTPRSSGAVSWKMVTEASNHSDIDTIRLASEVPKSKQLELTGRQRVLPSFDVQPNPEKGIRNHLRAIQCGAARRWFMAFGGVM
ncbi:hypothetical protein M413DRAFT_8794 [Hebeloma cylindrosporum]|uniref:Uncharacterized protein n=1 Tax=Hebeloma cylindrosporum TaxID=76867 RepID=A0A0C3CNP2_HEBCY|nr:hypothetical protein M413DRAFT_8794 [Hebeloma cylindrosporum h7]